MSATILREWRIKQGRFSARPLLRLWHALPRLWLGRRAIEFTFAIDTWWEPVPGVHDHIQKIAGISFGLNHHKNSIRLGFVPSFWENELNLFAYVYKDGSGPDPLSGPYDASQYLCAIKTGVPYRVCISTSTWPKAKLVVMGSLSKAFATKSIPIPGGNPLLFRLLSPYIEFGPGEGALTDTIIHLSKIKVY